MNNIAEPKSKSIKKIKVLFVCMDNSVRSQMAEAMVNHFFGNRFEAYSAGVEPIEINPGAIKAIAKIGIDISKHKSKNIDEFRTMKFDVIIKLCHYAKTFRSRFPEGKKHLDISFNKYCTSICCDYLKKSPACLSGKEGQMDKCAQALSEDKIVEQEVDSYFSFLREAIFYWFENEAVF